MVSSYLRAASALNAIPVLQRGEHLLDRREGWSYSIIPFCPGLEERPQNGADMQ